MRPQLIDAADGGLRGTPAVALGVGAVLGRRGGEFPAAHA
jgi:hypothetical protein